MSRWLLAIALAGCGTVPFPTPPSGISADDVQQPDGGGISAAQCEADFNKAVGNTCASTTDCMLLPHVNCCGTTVLGVAADTSSFAAEDSYEACEHDACQATPDCHHPDEAEDGTVLSTGEDPQLECVLNQCTSTAN